MIRAATLRDAVQIADLWNQMIRHTQSTFTSVDKSVHDIMDLIGVRTGAFFVALTNQKLIGFVTFGPFREGPGYAATAEHTILVADENQASGVGRHLMQAAESAARGLGHHVMVGAISHTNLDAQVFHRKLGYAEVGRMPQVGHKSGQWLDLVLMQKVL
ncbi:MAG: N-acetyltransferase family protein [Paracoccaceae bacterium]|nr:N-acetyltransferase family protein [Paracoccaceae bacterium]